MDGARFRRIRERSLYAALIVLLSNIVGILVGWFAAALRQTPFPIIGRIAADQFLLDPRTVIPDQDAYLLATLVALRESERNL